jgi:hypothetical protein
LMRMYWELNMGWEICLEGLKRIAEMKTEASMRSFDSDGRNNVTS